MVEENYFLNEPHLEAIWTEMEETKSTDQAY